MGADLRPMSLGELLDRTFTFYKQNFWLFISVSAIPLSVMLLVSLASNTLRTQQAMALQNPNAVTPSAVGSFLGVTSIIFILSLLTVGAAQAATVFAISDLYLDRPATVRGSFGRAGMKFLRVFLILFLFFLMAMVLLFCGAIAGGILGAIAGTPVLVFVGMVIVGFIGAYFYCRLSVTIPAAMIEDVGVWRSVGRSIDLTRGYAGQAFLIFLLVITILLIWTVILQFLFFGSIFSAILKHQALNMATTILYQIISFVGQVLIAPIWTVAFSLMYYNLRVRKEAFDVQHLMASIGTPTTPGTSPAI